MIKNSKYNKNLANDINILSSFEFKRFIKNNDYIKKDKNRINIFNSDYVLIPICYSDHWSLVNIHVKTKKVRYFDSLISLTTNSDRKKLINEFVSKIIVHDSAKIDFSTELSDWKFRNESLIPQQTNKYDCGIFICLFAKIISYDLKILPSQFSDEYIIGYRLRMLDEIKKVELLDNDFIYASQFDKKKH
jgi:Ulp1 family protease